MTVASTRTALYRLYGAGDELLYVGITKNLKARLRGHAGKKDWWPQVHRQEITWHDTREEALAVETEIIQGERPSHNHCFQVGRLPATAITPKELRREPVSITAVARMLGVNKATARQWRDLVPKQVEPFPPPAGKVAHVDYWWSDEILAWAHRTGRIKDGKGDRP